MKISACLLFAALTLAAASAQTPAPIVVPAANTSPAPATIVAPQPVANPGNALAAMETLKAANDVLLNKQTATLQKLDELQKAAEQLKIYSKRG